VKYAFFLVVGGVRGFSGWVVIMWDMFYNQIKYVVVSVFVSFTSRFCVWSCMLQRSSVFSIAPFFDMDYINCFPYCIVFVLRI
jgi:hypothetical protein